MHKNAALVVFVLLLTANTAAAVTIVTDDQYPVRGEPTTVTIEDETGPMEGALVQVEYRPNSSTPRTETLTPTDESGMTSWTPADAGLARLSIIGPDGPIESVAVSVRYTGFELSGIAIMLFAGIFLFGGAGYGMSLLLKEQKAPAEEPPST